MDVPICLISLLTDDVQWFKARVGLDVEETPKEISFCQYAVEDKSMLVVADATKDKRFKQNPLVTEDPAIRFYAGAPLIDADGIAIGTICVIDRKPRSLDDAQRKVLETLANTVMTLIQLRHKINEREIYAKFFTLNSDLLCVAGIDGFFKHINPAFTELLGWSKKELMLDSFFDFIHPEDVEHTAEKIQGLESGHKILGLKNRFKTKDGRWIWLEWSAESDQTSGELYAIARDLTNTLKVQHQIEEARIRAEKAVQSQEVFLSNINHEMRTPLNAIAGFTDLLQSTNLNRQQKDYVGSIESAADSLLALVTDVLDLAKIQDGTLDLQVKPTNIRELVAKVIKMQSTDAKRKGLKFFSFIDEEIPYRLVADPDKISQILINLISNSIKFTEQGYIELKVLLLEARSSSHLIRFAVKDTGKGIPYELQQKVFDRFVQVPDGSSHSRGTGLGLNIVKQLVNLHNGTLDIQSRPGHGSEFSIDLDLKTPDPLLNKDSKTINQGPESLNGIKVLVVEDNEHNQILSSRYIEMYGGEPTVAATGNDAIFQYKNNKYDVVLADLQLPDMTGYQVVDALKEINSNIKVLACSAKAEEREKQKCLEHGMMGFIAKPFRKEQLAKAITMALVFKPSASQPESDDFKSIVADLAEEDSQEFAQVLVDLFIKKVAGDMAQLKTALTNNKIDDLRQTAHRIAGTLASLRFNTGFHLAKKLEEAEGLVQIKKLTNELISYLQTAHKTLSK